MFIDRDGYIYLDEFKVLVNGEHLRRNYATRVFDDYYTDDCPYGNASNYNDYQETDEFANIALGQRWLNITVNAFMIILTAFLPPAAAISLGALTLIVTEFGESDPYSDAASVMDFKYHHQNGYWVTNRLAVVKHNMYLFPRTDFHGTVKIETTYFAMSHRVRSNDMNDMRKKAAEEETTPAQCIWGALIFSAAAGVLNGLAMVFDWDVRTVTFGCGLLSAVFAVRALVLLRKKNKTREAEGGSAAEKE